VWAQRKLERQARGCERVEEKVDVKSETDTAARALGGLRKARDLLRERRLDYHLGWFLCMGWRARSRTC
jgi:hypothetical protein